MVLRETRNFVVYSLLSRQDLEKKNKTMFWTLRFRCMASFKLAVQTSFFSLIHENLLENLLKRDGVHVAKKLFKNAVN
jgi:hypothetical protein